ncbi:MAG: helix-turn-helix domain-containing protein [Phycisphaerae bacterium]|nr:helix-turn-helix domain-containing protein [Gemmatimonadaceae bacterium]
MQDVSVSLGGYRGVRAELLVALKKAQPVTAHELGAQFGLTPNALRRYLKVLEEEGLVRFRRIVRGLGAPVYAFSLTESGESLFPRTYASVLVTALTALRNERGSAAVREVFSTEWKALANDAEPLMASLPLSERASVMAELLTARGYMADATTVATNSADTGEAVTTLRLHNCSMREIAEKFPEACAAEAQFVEEMLGVPMVREAHQLRGCRTCEYTTRSTPLSVCGAEPENEHPLKLAEKA